MRIAVFSDIHGNREALREVIGDALSRGCVGMFCLGDVVGYGAHPKECLDIVREYCTHIVGGNHEEIVCNFSYYEHQLMNIPAIEGARHAVNQLQAADIGFLEKLPDSVEFYEFGLTIAHGGFVSRKRWRYIDNIETASIDMGQLSTKIGVVGHTHVPVLYRRLRDGIHQSVYGPKGVYTVGGDRKCIANVGSVGQPRDGDPRANYGLFRFEDGPATFELVRVAYNVKQAAQDILKAGLPEISADRLFSGK